LKAFVEAHIIAKLEYGKAHCPNDTETLIMLLDLVVCPYISTATKDAHRTDFWPGCSRPLVCSVFQRSLVYRLGDKFDLGKELDAKRSREVY
jgi:hypothetical protein